MAQDQRDYSIEREAQRFERWLSGSSASGPPDLVVIARRLRRSLRLPRLSPLQALFLALGCAILAAAVWRYLR
jgi:hypothetical protein